MSGRDVLYEDVVVASLLDVKVETVRRACRARRIEGATKRDGRWFVPLSYVGPRYARRVKA